MADVDSQQQQQQSKPGASQKRMESVTITVDNCKELKGQRGDQITAVFKLEYGDRVLGESPKIETVPGQKLIEVNFSCPYQFNVDDAIQLDEICYRPFTCTILEMLPREKKQRDDKFITLGQCTFDIFSIMQGTLLQELTLPIHAVPGSPLEHLKGDEPKPEISVTVSLKEPLFSESEANQFNIMKIVIGSLYSPPDQWQTSTPQQQQPYLYCAAMPAPFNNEQALVFPSGSLKGNAEKETPDRRLRWYLSNKMIGGSQYIPNSQLQTDPIELEDGDYRGRDDVEFRRTVEQEKHRINWNNERRCFIDHQAEKKLQDRIAQCRYWPLEVFRLQPPQASPQKKGAGKPSEDDILVSYHGVAYLNLAHLLYPGVKRIRGVFKVDPFYESEMQEKAKAKGSLIGDSTRQLFGISRMSSATKVTKTGDKNKDARRELGKDKASTEGAVAGVKQQPANSVASAKNTAQPVQLPQVAQTSATRGPEIDSARKDADGQPIEETNPEGQIYREMKSYIYIDISLQRPLIKKRSKEEQLVKVSEIIPPRPLYPRKVQGAARAVKDYHKQIAVVAGEVVEEFRRLFAEDLETDEYDTSPETIENRRAKLVSHLAESGRYYVFRERLKYVIVKIVREKFMRTGAFENEEDYQSFLSDLYTYLVDEMRTSLNGFLEANSGRPPKGDKSGIGYQLAPNFTLGSEQLKQFAKEAEIIGDFELANRYYQERLARDQSDPDFWFDYGVFCMSINELVKAEECFRECLSLNRTHIDGLTMCGVVSTLLEEHTLALTCLETVTVLDPENAVAWTLLGIFYESTGNDIGMEMAYGESERLNQAGRANFTQPTTNNQSPAVQNVPANSEQLGLPQASAQPQNQPAPNTATEPPETPVKSNGPLVPAPPVTSKTSKTKNLPAVSSSHSSASNQRAAGKTTNRSDYLSNDSKTEGDTIFMQTALYVLKNKSYAFTERALAHHLIHPQGGTSPRHLEVLARLLLEKRELTDADENISEALKVNYRKADAWALCGHIKYFMNDVESAKQCYERSLAFESDPSDLQEIYIRLGMVYLRLEEYPKARDTFLLACKRQPSAITWLGVGISCYRMDVFDDAESALCEANLLNNFDPVIWAYLSLVSLKMGRRLEAEQAYKFSRKLRLKDEKLIEELKKLQKEVGFGNPEFATSQQLDGE